MIELDKEFETPTFIVCDLCKNIIKEHKTCKAFPQNIPDEILSGKSNHLKPLKDQSNDIIFEPLNNK